MGINSLSCPTLFIFLWALLRQRAECGSASVCDLSKLISCRQKSIEIKHEPLVNDITELYLNEYCNKVNDVLACTSEVIHGGCEEDEKCYQRSLQPRFRLIRDTLCGKDVRLGLVEYNKCRDESVKDTCWAEARDYEEQGSWTQTTSSEDDFCRNTKTRFYCLSKEVVGCLPDAQPGIEAMKKYLRGLLAIQACLPPCDCWNAGPIFAPWDSVILGALCSTLFFSLLYQAAMLQASS